MPPKTSTESSTSPDMQSLKAQSLRNLWTLKKRCAIYASNGEIDLAIPLCEEVIDTAGDHPAAIMELRNLYAAKGRFDTAIEMHRKLLSGPLSKLEYTLQDYDERVKASEVKDFQ